MLPKHYRLNLEDEINFVLKKGRRASTPFFAVSCVFVKGDEGKRFGFLVSKKVSNKTTARNLIKRRMRAVVAKNLSTCRAGTRCIFIARPQSLGADYVRLESEMLRSMKTLGIMANY